MNSRWLCVLAAVALTWSGASLLPQGVFAQEEENVAADVDFRAAVALHKLEQWEDAEKAWQKFVKDYPSHKWVPEAKFYLGVCQFQQEKYDAAISTFKDLIAKHPSSKRLEAAHVFVAHAQVNAARKDAKRKVELLTAAIATCNAQLMKWPTGTHAGLGYYRRGDASYLLGKKDDALKDFSIIVEKFGAKNPNFADALYSIGFIYQEQQKWEPAGNAYKDFLTRFDKAQPKHPLLDEVRMRYGETLLERQQFTEAEGWLQAAADAPKFPLADMAASRLADSFARRKKHAEAAKTWLSIPEKFPNLRNVDANFARLEGGRNAFLAGDYELTRTALVKVIAVGGEKGAEAAHWTALSFLRQQKPTEALQVIQSALPKAAGTSFEADLMLDRGDALFETPERQKLSVSAFYETYTKFPTHRAAAQALYNAAFAALRADDAAAAVKYAQEFRQKLGKHALLTEVMFVEAEGHSLLKNYDKAAPIYVELLRIAPQHRDAELWKVRIGLCHFFNRNYGAAVEALQPVAAGVKNELHRVQAYYLLGSSQLELKRLPEAVKSLQTAVEAKVKWPEADDAEVTLARVLRTMKDCKNAIRHLRNVLEKYPDSNVKVEARFHLAECLYELGDNKPAVAEYQWVIDNGKSTAFVPYALHGQGWNSMKLNDAAAAQRTFERLVNEFPKHELVPRGYLGRGKASQELRRFDSAEADFVKFLSLEPKSPDRSAVRHEIGKCQVAQKKPGEAVATFTAVLAEDKAYAATADLLADLAWTLKELGKPGEAAKRFQEVYEKSPDSALGLESLYQVAEHLFTEKEYLKAYKVYFEVSKKADELRSNGKVPAATAHGWREKALYKYGFCYFNLGQFDNSEKTFGYQLATYPKGEFASDAVFMTAESQAKQKKYEPALEGYANYLGKFPAGRLAPLAMLHAAQTANLIGLGAESGGDSAKAKKLFQQGLELGKKFGTAYSSHELLADALYEQGWSLQNLGQFDEAIKQYVAVIPRAQKREVGAKARFMMGEIYFARKEYGKAVTEFARAAYGYGYPEWQRKSLFEMARCLELQKKPEAARKVYLEIIERFPESEESKRAKERMKVLGE